MQKATVLTLHAPAKINATLEILSRRDDGYHLLRSVMLPVGLYDRIEIIERGPGSTTFHVDDEALAHDNLVMRALAACGAERPLDVRLHKSIPTGGGLGGGSSDAATIVRAAMNGELGAPADRDWLRIARTLGSDVPFFLAGTGALIEGTGERVTPIGRLPPWWVTIAQPHVSVATADAYRLLASLRAREGPPATRTRAQSVSLHAVDAIQRQDFDAFQRLLVNDFHDPILATYPAVASAVAALRVAGAHRPLLSGSGSCVFAIFANETDARRVAAELVPDSVATTFVVPLHHDATWR